MPEIVVAICSLIGTLVGSLAGIMTANKLTTYRIEQLEEKVKKHNNLVERMIVVEQSTKSAHHRLDELIEEREGHRGMKDWKNWVKCAGIRAVKTVAQTMIATIGTATALGQVNAKLVISASILSGVLSLLTSIAGLPECNTEGE